MAAIDISISSATIDILNDDCIRKIVSNLNPNVILELERVSSVTKLWADLYWGEFFKFDIDRFLKEEGPHVKHLIRDILKKSTCLKEFSLVEAHNKFPGICTKIADYVPDIEVLTLDTDCDDHDINLLASTLRNLQKVSLCSEYGSDEGFALLLKNNVNITYFKIRRNRYMNGSCLVHLPPKLKELHLDDLPFLNSDTLVNALPNLTNLHTLTLDSCHSLENNCIEDITKLQPTLKKLSLRFLNMDVRGIANLKELKSLDISFNNIADDNNLRMICTNCQNLEEMGLGYLKFRDVEPLTPHGIMYLSHLPNLKVLRLSRINLFFDSNIEQAANFKQLHDLRLKNCLSITDGVAMSIMHYCRSLKRLELQYCPMTESIIRDSILKLNNRSQKKFSMKLIIDRPYYNAQGSNDFFKITKFQAYLNDGGCFI